jgi:hypothetical protein
VNGPLTGAELAGLKAALDGRFPFVSYGEPVGWTPAAWGQARAGLALGTPTVLPPDPADGAAQIDRLIRGLAGLNWAFLVLAEPVPAETLSRVRDAVIDEMRQAKTAAQSRNMISPRADAYHDLLKAALEAHEVGQTVGSWRVAAYLAGDPAGFAGLAAGWLATFSGEHSLPEPLRVWDWSPALGLAADWSLPDLPGQHFNRPYLLQSLISSAELAAYVHVPRLETGGFAIKPVVRFGAVPPTAGDGPLIDLGPVVHMERETGDRYAVSARRLTQHVFVAGITGAGKTNTMLHLLRQLAPTPFLVIEPAKSEYRAMHGLMPGGLRVHCLGDERRSEGITESFRFNPFEIPLSAEDRAHDPASGPFCPRTSISTHIDLLRSAFSAGFGDMWPPLPQVLETSLQEVYLDRGWDLTSNTNHRLTSARDVAQAFPTLSELAAKIEEVAPRLGFDAQARERILGHLRARINSLRAGGKGRMLDVRESTPIEHWLGASTVMELEGLGDEGDKAIMIGLLIARVVEQRRLDGQAHDNGLRHLLVIEEAHRLLADVRSTGSDPEGGARRKAVETFSNLLVEIRSYGQGVVIIDQVPTKLAPDVIKNTRLKIVHAVVAEDDRRLLAGAMAMTEDQSRALTAFIKGRVAVFGEGDDEPILVQVKELKDALRERAAQAPPPPESGRRGDAARALAEDREVRRAFGRLVLAATEDPAAERDLWDDLVWLLRGRCPAHTDAQAVFDDVLERLAARYAEDRGRRSGRSYGETNGLSGRLSSWLKARLAAAPGDAADPGAEAAREAFAAALSDFHRRRLEPYPACDLVCPAREGRGGPLCLYRFDVADLVAGGEFRARWGESRDPTALCLEAQDRLLGPPAAAGNGSGARRRLALCFYQQMESASGVGARELRQRVKDSLGHEAMP